MSGEAGGGYFYPDSEDEITGQAAPALECPGCGSPDVDLRCGLWCGTCAATVTEEAGDGH